MCFDFFFFFFVCDGGLGGLGFCAGIRELRLRWHPRVAFSLASAIR
ncbi:hypothetical protein K788_0008149 [Paraburkholderia caribensis MBA4]|uniref:Uncharacterized protein n=1 Tax=Paraburkholderia caribensis MBA4 TaxID=1323664 RepID=A0A0P0RFQ1_9BURK|nr:hypothetical protein K788_0008149 [Paraburkholderia caribensis MBA4]